MLQMHLLIVMFLITRTIIMMRCGMHLEQSCTLLRGELKKRLTHVVVLQLEQ